MTPITVSAIVYILAFMAYLLGLKFRSFRGGQLVSESAVIAINNSRLALMVLTIFSISSLLVASKGNYDLKEKEITIQAAKIIYLDSILKNWTDASREARITLREFVKDEILVIQNASHEKIVGGTYIIDIDTRSLVKSVVNLKTQNDVDDELKRTSISLVREIISTRWITFEELGSSIFWPLIILITLWLMIVMTSFGMVSKYSSSETLYFAFFIAVISSAIYLTLELDLPFRGLIHVSINPLSSALNSISTSD